MENGIRIRKTIFDRLMEDSGNRINWEMLCSSDKPLVPFMGAGISAWCYPTWNDLLIDTVREKFSLECAEIVERALGCDGTPNLENKENEKIFHWMEEIAESIFGVSRSAYKKYKKKFKLADSSGSGQNTDAPQGNEMQSGAGNGEESRPNNADSILQQLRDYVGEESKNKKREAVNALYDAFGDTRLKEKKNMPEYQKFFHKIFSCILVTTNYDKVLEYCYPSLFSYSYIDLNDRERAEKNWLYKAVQAKLKQRQNELDGMMIEMARVPVPENPMLLKVHGSVEHASEIALTASGYEKVYTPAMEKLLGLIFEKSTLIFMGSGLREDRFLDELLKCRNGQEFCHFAFLPAPESKIDQKTRREELESKYGIYPIFYDAKDLKELYTDEKERQHIFHDYFLGLLLENLSRRTMHYPQPLELLWDKYRFKDMPLDKYINEIKGQVQRDPQYVHRKEALQIFELLNSSEECPLIAITGNTGSGKSTLCQGIQELPRNYKDTMQFFYIALADCRRWDEFCLQLYQTMNIVELEIPKPEEWEKAAERVAERCGAYWRSVVILDQLDELKQADGDGHIWEIIKKILGYWKRHQMRVVFTCRDYPDGLSCYVWHIGELKNEEARMVFFSACTSKRYRNISLLEQKVVSELFDRQSFQPASARLLGSYANSKNDLNGLLEEWELYHKPGDKEGQLLARILWNHLLEEHRYKKYKDKDKEQSNKSNQSDQCRMQKIEENNLPEEQSEQRRMQKIEKNNLLEKRFEQRRMQEIEENILWVWGILGSYPGIFPSAFFETILKDAKFEKRKELTNNTLMFMKNAGLCEESGDERKSILLNNILYCAENYFLKKMAEHISAESANGAEQEQLNEEFQELYQNFRKNVYASEKEYYGQKCFRGYAMDNYEGQLRKYVLAEIKETVHVNDPEDDILKILNRLGMRVEDDKQRAANKELNLVLRYEIKTVVRFLRGYLLKDGVDDAKKKKIVKIACRFAHYFHYMPNYSQPLVLQLIDLMKDCDRRHLYQLAKLKRVMGDIKMQTGCKKEAAQYYQASMRLCNEQMLALVEDENRKYFDEECSRIRAGVLLKSSDFKTLYDKEKDKDKDKEEGPLGIYEKLGDRWGQAYYYQRMGEMMFDEANKKMRHGGIEIQKRYFSEIMTYFNQSIEIYEDIGEKTGMAYILKCMGDLIEKMNDAYQSDYVCVKSQKKGDISYKICEKKGEGRSGCLWIYDAVCCYTQAFIYYYGHVNWRGFANVLQAMGTMYHEFWTSQKKDIGCVEKLYGLAEECYRWLGDMGGLADTLAYFGFGYEDCLNNNYEECPDDRYAYMALSKWMESKKIWKEQGNEEKVGDIDQKIKDMRRWLLQKKMDSQNHDGKVEQNGGTEDGHR